MELARQLPRLGRRRLALLNPRSGRSNLRPQGVQLLSETPRLLSRALIHFLLITPLLADPAEVSREALLLSNQLPPLVDESALLALGFLPDSAWSSLR